MIDRPMEAPLSRLCAIVAGIVGDAVPIGIETRAADVRRWNSHATVEIILATEDAFGFQMSNADMERVGGVADLLAIVVEYCGDRVA